MNEHKILEEAFKEEFGDNWQIEMRNFEHGFSSFYDASINAIKRALVLSNVSNFVACPYCKSKMIVTQIHYPGKKKDYQCCDCKQYFC